MAFWNRNKQPAQKRSVLIAASDQFESLISAGYTPLSRNPEVAGAVNTIADLIASMTIHLMANTESGDVRIKNELSRAIDIAPTTYLTRTTWMKSIVQTLLLYGNGNSVVYPHTKDGLLGDLEPISYGRVNFVQDGRNYKVLIDGIAYSPDSLLHFVWNPDPTYPWKGQGLKLVLSKVVETLEQAAATKKSFMASKWKPSIVVKVDALTDEFSSKAGRKKLLEDYISTTEVGEPWMIPADQFDVQTIKPLSLQDLAISDSVTIDKRTVASLFGIPPFVLGVGEYNDVAWNAFIRNKIRPIAVSIEQEMTKKLILSPKMYLRFNVGSLYSYDLQKTATVYGDLAAQGIVTGNEVRDKIGEPPMEGLDELTILENYIPRSKIGMQMKLNQEE